MFWMLRETEYMGSGPEVNQKWEPLTNDER